MRTIEHREPRRPVPAPEERRRRAVAATTFLAAPPRPLFRRTLYDRAGSRGAA